MKKFFLKTFGCKTNQSDSNSLKNFLLNRGWQISCENPDVCFINSCVVTRTSEKKVLKEAQKLKQISKRVIVFGCLTPQLKETLKEQGVEACPVRYRSLSNGVEDEIVFSGTGPRYFLKIQNGCSSFCSFCIVPYVRGKPVSFSPQRIFQQLHMAKEKFKISEIVINGTNIMKYSFENYDLLKLLEEISRQTPARIRLTSLSLPFEKDFVRRISQIKNICPHFHISLQSASNRILKLMKRNYTREIFEETVAWFREFFTQPAITTDVIYGFPFETDADFKKTVDFIEKIEFARVHIFPFSPRPKTLAGLFNTIPPDVLKKRRNILKKVIDRVTRKYKQKFVNKILDVVVEEKKNGFYTGTSQNYLKVKFKGYPESCGIAKVFIEKTDAEFMWGRQVRNE
ncbi:MAG: MiaB/RimO family radical SAM methylthiotransferase [Elusimicrobia bacterium]|nr:MiaB/RimO family radical SAM methylthiotransferase [Elusimicrobiota bacterium]